MIRRPLGWILEQGLTEPVETAWESSMLPCPVPSGLSRPPLPPSPAVSHLSSLIPPALDPSGGPSGISCSSDSLPGIRFPLCLFECILQGKSLSLPKAPAPVTCSRPCSCTQFLPLVHPAAFSLLWAWKNNPLSLPRHGDGVGGGALISQDWGRHKEGKDFRALYSFTLSISGFEV